ncbi:zinc finger protein 454-like [Topomyia yanbarensis]|uniref:zinc finger protein 454-like n=1 Tax=Topomyia yanbarensis TaxID=2498891 RepID=UPI00273B9433|nr:zinc finger protein 454-like [Topomyia yanbarensis]
MFDSSNLLNICRACLNDISTKDSVLVSTVEESSAKSYHDLLHEWHPFDNQPGYDNHFPKYLCLDCTQRIDGILKFQTETVSNSRLLFAIVEVKVTSKTVLLRKLLRSEKSRQTLSRMGFINSKDDVINQLLDGIQPLHSTCIKQEIQESVEPNSIQFQDYIDREDKPEYSELCIKSQFPACESTTNECNEELVLKFEPGEETIRTVDTGPTQAKQSKKVDRIRKRPCLVEGCEPVIIGQTAQHIKEKHRTYCKICGLVFSSYYLAASHIAVHKPSEQLLSCDVCFKTFCRDQDLKNHLLLVHARIDAKHVCPFCEQGFQMIADLKKHREIHLNSPCHLCGKSEPFKDYKHLADHFRKNHDKQLYKCGQCSTAFLGRRELEIHNKKHHDGSLINCVEFAVRQWDDTNHCASCEKIFYTEVYLKSHAAAVHKLGEDHDSKSLTALDQEEYKFKCNTCSSSFRLNTSLKRHTRKVHGSERIACEQCGASFKTSSEVNAHIRYRHTKDFWYKCEFCDKPCNTSSALAVHRRTHTNERPCKCPYEGCVKNYKTHGALQKHVRANHTNERPYKCHYESCNKAYICSQHLKAHIHWHTREKPFKCFYCELYFSTSPNRRKHCQVHHPGKPVGKELEKIATNADVLDSSVNAE